MLTLFVIDRALSFPAVAYGGACPDPRPLPSWKLSPDFSHGSEFAAGPNRSFLAIAIASDLTAAYLIAPETERGRRDDSSVR